MEGEFATETKRTKAESLCQSYKDSIFPLQGVLILKRKKRSLPLLPPPTGCSLLPELSLSAEGQLDWGKKNPKKPPLLGLAHLGSHIPSQPQPPFTVCF